MSSTNRSSALLATAKAASGAAHCRLLALIGGRNLLEIVMAILTVTNVNDGGSGSLREAIATANAGDTNSIQFAFGSTNHHADQRAPSH
jgi:hypothetical protein